MGLNFRYNVRQCASTFTFPIQREQIALCPSYVLFPFLLTQSLRSAVSSCHPLLAFGTLFYVTTFSAYSKKSHMDGNYVQRQSICFRGLSKHRPYRFITHTFCIKSIQCRDKGKERGFMTVSSRQLFKRLH
jgi:hypothetical protein